MLLDDKRKQGAGSRKQGAVILSLAKKVILELIVMKNYGGLIQGFFLSCQHYPENKALKLKGQSYSYRELGGLALKLARAIDETEKTEPEPNPLAAVFAARSLLAYAGVLGVLASGRGYVPLNPRFPLERTLRMLKLSGVSTVLLGKEVLPLLEKLLAGLQKPMVFLAPEVPDSADILKLQEKYPQHSLVSATELDARVDPAHTTKTNSSSLLKAVYPQKTAYLMFTSGSTGQPKGVPVTHANVLAYIQYIATRYAVNPQDRFSQMFDLTFDLSVHDMFVCWEKGACLYPVPEEALMAPARLIQEHELTMWFSVPSAAMFMKKLKLLKPGVFPSLRYSLFCGEALPAPLAAAWQKAAPNSTLENLYGPTEATIAIAHYTWQEEGSPAESLNGIVPLGEIFAGHTGVIINEERQVLERGQKGELCLFGAQVTAGYLNDGEKTKEQFICLDAFPGHIFYRTGDRVQEDEKGIIHFLGRIDNQVQILGHRVELLEIDHVLREACGTEGVVAVAWPLQEGIAEGIYAFIQADATTDIQKILSSCRTRLPAYMVPRKVLLVDSFPLNASGKIDRHALTAKLAQGDI